MKSFTGLNTAAALPEVFLGKGALKMYSKFKREQPCQSAISKSCFVTLLKLHFSMGALL